MDGTERSVVWEYGPAEQQHIRDANRANDQPDGLTFDVQDGEVIATGSAESIRWLYDYLHYLKRAWRNEGEQWDADAAEEMAESLYEQVDGELPERQRNKEVMTDGGTDRPDAETIGSGGGPRDDPLIPCHRCGTEERFMAMKRDPEWTLEYLDAPRWVAFCPDCDARNGYEVDTDTEQTGGQR